MIPYGKQDINQDDINAVLEVLTSDFLTQGPKVPLFEKAFIKKCAAKFGVAVNSATSALHIANLALGVGKGDLVWTSPITFVATANSALYCGAAIDFVDINLMTGNICVDALERKLIFAEENNTLPKVIIPVHLAGQSCDMAKIHALSLKYRFKIIEDASHAVGAKYKGKPVGSCQYSDITVFSFHPVKIITSAEGGLAVTNNKLLAQAMRQFRSHGIVSDEASMTEPSHGPWYYQQIGLGFNYRMTELQAALGLSQMTRLDEFVTKRNALAKIYDQAFNNTSLLRLTPNDNAYSSYHLYIVLLASCDKGSHKNIISQLREKNICAHLHYIPVHTQPYYQKLGFKDGDYPIAEEYYQRAISLPLYPNLAVKEQQYIIDTLLSEIKTSNHKQKLIGQ
ncbi:UDP-4-amino-4,6-dideoxy-N-acetyl-beta-L-altrosamine transaminase [Colwellia ponticola]|uniref:UDP-4-amino-4, 6-dideoxy-N-acetyl-beta-L-altrosamine transaminase n=1 Tax=Colwellia ponticola TaxID=2304625 RepID=A0A8H2JLK3_9GAMM|nr:UDP-4-amino-4,6-dideoxy-N-acetyl-beta-L-altrosamine transaminase [Colwellia ponticola]TMM44971.1 UDP-4-amino-4,6-dideoxy-N-acetyl-beta-L-altrosamine transaminase [Colwellia ponticola]